jgi:hypothetical protein
MYKWNKQVRNTVLLGGLLGFCVSLPLLVVSSACAGEPAADEQALLERAGKYWEARVASSPELLDFYAPPEKGGPKFASDRSEFGNVKYQGAEVTGAVIDGDQAMVRIRITASIPLAAAAQLDKGFWTREIREEWLKVDGTWYKKPVPLGFSRPSPPRKESPGPDESPTPASAAASPGAGAQP